MSTSGVGGAGGAEMARALVRFNAHLMGAMLALTAGVALFVATLFLMFQGGPMTGQLLGQLAYFFPGYGISFGGAILGGLWAAVVGYAVGFVVGRAYGPWLFRSATHMLESRKRELGPVMELRPLPFAIVSAALAAAALFLATNWLWIRSGFRTSPQLELLGWYLPGYTTDLVGSIVGAFWLFLYAFVAAFVIAWVYDRVASARA